MKTLIFAAIAFCLSLQAGALEYENWSFTVSGGEATLTGYSGTGPEDLVLPSTVSSDGTNYTVTAVGDSAFNGKQWIKTLRMPDTIRRIGSRAFGSCNGLADILIPASVTNLADNVFHSSSGITNAVILAQADVIDLGMFPTESADFDTLVVRGNGRTLLKDGYGNYAKRPRHVRIAGVRRIGGSCFSNYPNLLDIVFEDDALEEVGSYAFQNCTFSEVPCFGATSRVKLIEGNAFNNCRNLTSIVVPDSVTNIADNAFNDCPGISSVTLGSGMETVSGGFLGGQTNLTSLVIRGNGQTRVAGFREKAFQSVTISGVSEIYNSAFSECRNLRTVELAGDGNLRSIWSWAFHGCTNLLSVAVPNSVTNIANYAFHDCYALTNAVIGTSVERIGDNAFQYCHSLLGIEIPASVTSVGGSAFNSCESIREVVWHGNDGTIDGSVFSSQTNWVSLVIDGNGNTRVSGFSDKAYQNLTISGVSAIADSAFKSCYNLRTVEFADDIPLGNIGWMAFAYNQNLASVVVPNSVTNIANYAFYDCAAMTNAVIGTNVEIIGGCAFQCCHSLLGVEIPSSVTSVGGSAFSDCESIREVVWHGNDGTIDGSVFSGQTNWVSLAILGNGNTRVSGFGGKSIQHVTISGVSAIADSAFRYCDLRDVAFADGIPLGKIGWQAFAYNHNLASVTIPASVTNISDYAFYDCVALKTVVFESDEAPAVGGTEAFNGIPSDAVFYIHEGATGYDATQYPWNSWSVVTLMDDGTVGQSGAINASVTWHAGVPYQILAPLRVRGSSTVLSIEPGAEVRFAEGASLAVENGGAIDAAGTLENPVVFTSAAATKAAGDWEYIGGNSGRVSLRCATVEYGGGKSGAGSIYGYGANITLDRVTVQHSENGALCGAYIHATNSVLRASEKGVSSASWNSEIHLVNCVVDECDVALDSNYATAYNTIVANCLDVGTRGYFHRCLFDAECRCTAANYGNGNLAGDPKFLPDTFYRIAADSPAVDAGSGKWAPDADYFGAARMASTNVVAVGEPNARGICPDIGICEVEGLLEVNLPDRAVESVALPATLVPGVEAEFSYVVTNRGDGIASAPWTEQLWLTNASGCVRLQSWRATEGLSTNAAVERTFAIVVPDTIDLSGSVRALVRLDTDRDVIQKEECSHEGLSDEATLNGKLTISLGDSVREGGWIWGQVKRSGGNGAALSVALSATGDTAAQVTNMPQTVTLNAGSATAGFYVTVADNAEVDGDRDIVVAAEATGFSPVEKALMIVDDEVPQLTLEVVGVTTNAFTEGTNLTIRVRRPAAVSGKALTVYLGGVNSSQFSYPSSITLAAGEEYAEFTFASVDDSSSELAAALTLRASANGYASAQYDFTLEDDDIPGVELTLSPEAVSEGAGLNAVYAVLSRTDDDAEKLKKAITVFLTASEEGALILPSSVAIPANTRSVRFAIGVVDNDEMESGGGRVVTISAAIRIDSCGCSWRPQESGGALEAELEIADNDGPALFVTADPTTMREGLAEAGVLTVRANSASVAQDVVVTLSHDGASEIALPATVTIPAGANSATAVIQTLDDGEEDGSKVVSVYAEAQGFAPGSTWVLVTDQNLPDFAVRNVRPSEAIVIAGETIEVEFDLANVGFRNRAGSVPYSVYWVEGTNTWRYAAKDRVLVGVTEEGVSTNAPLHVVCEVPAPESAGNGRIAVVADPDGTIVELDAANNSAWSDAVTVSPAYVTEDVACDKAVYGTGEKITVTGVAVKPDGVTRAANVEVEVYLVSGGMRRTLTATTDDAGEFAASYTPMSGEIGRFGVGASYPGLDAAAVQATCDVAGFVLGGLPSSRYVEDLTLGDVVTNASARIRNPCGVALTGVVAEAVGLPESCGLEILGVPADGVLAAGEFIEFRCVFTAAKASVGRDYEKFSIRLSSAEGAELTIPVYFYSQAKQAHIESSPASISATMTKGKTRTVSFALTNLGYGEAVDVRVVSPDVDWLRVVGGTETASLTNNQSVTVTLELSPGEDIELNRNFSGRISVNGRNKGEDEEQTFLTIPMTFMAVSEETGGVRVDCVDDATYNLESAPHLEGAHVRITNPYTGAVVAEGESGADGLFEADGIPEGTYQLVVTAAKHGNYAAAVEVNPGRTTRVTAFLQYQAITANWTVTRTEIEDQYQVDLVLEFETSVPVPVVKLDFIDKLPDIQPGESYATKAVFSNLGLIRADEVSLELPSLYGYVWVYPTGSFSLAAGAARAVPVVLYRLPYTTEDDYQDYVDDTSHTGETSGGIPHDEIAGNIDDERGGGSGGGGTPSMPEFIGGVYGGPGMKVVQHGSRAGSGTSATHAGPLNPGESGGNPCKGWVKHVYGYECVGTRWVQTSRELVFGDDCPSVAAPAVPFNGLEGGSSEPSRGVEQKVNIPPGMNGGDFWVFEDGCGGGVSNKLKPCLKDLAKAGVDLEMMMFGKVVPGAGPVIEFSQKMEDWHRRINDPEATEADIHAVASEMRQGLKGYVASGDETLSKLVSTEKALKAAGQTVENYYAASGDNGRQGKAVVGGLADIMDQCPDSIKDSKLGKIIDNLNFIKQIDDAFEGVKQNCLPIMNGSGVPGSALLRAAPRSAKTFAETVSEGGPTLTGNVREDAFAYATDVLRVFTYFVQEVFGNSDGWRNATYDDLAEFLASCDAAMGADGHLGADAALVAPEGVTAAEIATFKWRWNNMLDDAATAEDPYADDFGSAGLVRIDVLSACADRANAANSYAKANGADSIVNLVTLVLGDMLADALDETESFSAVCAKVSLKLSQTYTMTREAFEGTLTLYNGHDSAAMTNVWLELEITNADGDNCNGLFEISAKSGGSLEANGSNVVNVDDVASKSEGTTVVQFVPAVAAAPETPVAYKFGGKVHYRDPFTGEEAAITLLPVTLEVNPTPQLYLDYFVQRDVYADNPFTKDIIEASMPAELAVLVRNEGYGDAKNVKIESVQPEVVENEKGLMIDFRLSDYSLDAAALNGATAGLGLSDVSLGTIAARTSSVAQWWLTSTLQGHFTGMRASVTHLNSQGIVDTSLIREVAVHPLIRSVDVGDALPAFLTADGSRYGNPDRLYRADGEILDVRSDATASTADSARGAQCEITVTASVPGSGPFYAKVALPGAEEYEVVGLERAGVELPVRNAWITDRTFVDGADPKVETFLHLFDSASSAGEKSYTVTLRAKPTDAPAVSGFEGVVPDALVTNPVESVIVVFTKAIDSATFTADDVAVWWQGTLTNGVVASITPADDSGARYTIALNGGFARSEGRFIVQAFSSGVTSLSGTLGRSEGRQIGWTYYVIDKPAVVTIRGWLDGTTVNSVANVTVQFASAIDPESFTCAAIKVDGVAVGNEVVFSALNKANTSFKITGLDQVITSRRGVNDHTIEIDTSLVRNAAGVPGVAKFTSTVTIDANAPTAELSDDGEVFGSRRWTLTFSKPVVASTVSASALSLTRDGAAVAIPASARLTQVSDTIWTLSGLDAALGADGAYALSFDASQVRDASGNAGDGNAVTSEWTFSSQPPALIDDLAFAPDWGTNATDGVTWQRNVTITGTLTNGAYSVEILARDAAGGEAVLVETFYPEAETSFEKPAVLPIGRGTIVVRCANSSGKSSDSEKEFFVDAIPLSFEFAGFPEEGEGMLTNDVALVFSEPVTNVTAECFSIRRDVREEIDIPAGALTITPDASNHVWTVAGIDALMTSGGTYTVTFDLSRVEKLSSGLHGEFDEEAHSVSWHYAPPDTTPPDTTPPELVKIVFDDEEAYGPSGVISVASNGASQVKFVFSEPMNFSALQSTGWLGRALRLQILDDVGSVTGEVALAASQLQWRSGENAIVWTRDERAFPVGRVRFFLDAGLLTDAAGNSLVGNSGLDSFLHFSKRERLFTADGKFATPANFGGELVVGVKKDGSGEAYYYGWNGEKGARVVDGVSAANCLGVSVAKIDGDVYHGTYDGKVYKNGTLLADVNVGRQRAVLSVWNGTLVIGGDDGRLVRLDGTALKDEADEDLVVDSGEVLRSAAAFSSDWTYEGRPLMVVGRGKGGLALYVGDGEGRWDGVKTLGVAGSATTNLYERTRPVAIDVNGDGLDDLVTGYADGTVDVRYASVNKAFVYEFDALPSHTPDETPDYAAKAGEYFKKTLTELGYEVPTNGTVFSVVAKGLPAGIKLKYNAAVKDKKGRVIKKAKTEWWIEGVPTAALDYMTSPAYLVITVNGVPRTFDLPVEVLAQDVRLLDDLELGQSMNTNGWLEGVGAGWTVSGLPTGLKYATKRVTKKSGKKTIVVAEAYAVYGKTTKAGLFTITAKKKVGAFYETKKFRVLVRPAAVDASLFGDNLTNLTTMAYVPFEWHLTNDVSSVGGKVVKVTGLPTGLAFAAKDTYAYKNAKKKTGKYLKQRGQTIVGKPTKAGTYVVTFTKNVTIGTGKNKRTVAKTAQILWTVVANDAELTLGFNNIGGVVKSGVVGLKYTDVMAFSATSDATVTASGLPAGIKLVNLGDGNYAFTGFTTKAGTYLVTVTATLNGKSVSQRVALEVDGLPAWAKGTFNGYVAGDDGATNGLATVTVSSVGKVSGKFYDRGTNWTFTAASYTDFDGAAYSVPVSAKFSWKVKSGKKTVNKTVYRAFTLTVVQDAIGGKATLVEAGGSTVHAWQNLWGSKYKVIGKKLFFTSKKKQYRTFTIKGASEIGVGMGMLPAETLSLKVTPAGAVTATMSFDTGKKSKGKAVIYKATCSTVVIPLTPADAAEFDGLSYLFFAPSPKNSFPGLAAAAPF